MLFGVVARSSLSPADGWWRVHSGEIQERLGDVGTRLNLLAGGGEAGAGVGRGT